MTSRILKILAIVATISLVAGCKLAVMVPSGGDVTSASGTRNCTGGSLCEHNITDLTFNETFTAVARPGYVFSKWNKGGGFYCGDSTNPTCTISNVGAGVIAGIGTYIAGGSFSYAMPLFEFVGIDTDGDGSKDHLDGDDDNDGIPDLEDECPYYPNPSCGVNEVSGMILEDTTWSAVNGPLRLAPNVEVAPGVTLTITAGTEVIGFGGIDVYGRLDILGTSENPVILRQVNINPMGEQGDPETGVLNINYAHSLEGAIWTTSSNYGSLTLRNSLYVAERNGNYQMYLRYPSSNTYIENNVFKGGLFIEILLSGPSVFIRNNLFTSNPNMGSNFTAIFNSVAYSGSVLVEQNNFMPGNTQLYVGSSPSSMTARNNYWGTTDTNIIEGMIYDRTDTLSASSYIEYQPILLAPHPDTPTGF